MSEQINPMDVVRKEIRERLEDKCREIAGLLPKGRTDSEINEYLWLAKLHGFEDIAEVLNNARSNLAGMIIDSHTAPRRRIKQEERKLEDYVCANGNLGKIEPGLQFVERQFSTAAGDIDILARDTGGREVIVELKTPTGRYDKKYALDEIRGYLEDRKDARAILAVPYIDYWLYSRLKHFTDNGKLKVMLVNQQGQEYEFRDLRDEDVKITSKKQRDAMRRKMREGQNSEVISLIKKVRAVKESETDPEKSREGISDMPAGKDENLDNLPLYYQVLSKARPRIIGRERYLQPIQISSEQMGKLEELVSSASFQDAIENLRKREQSLNNYDCLASLSELGIKNRKNAKAFSRAGDAIGEYMETINMLNDSLPEFVECIPRAMSKGAIDIILDSLRAYSRDFSKVVDAAQYGDKDLSDMRIRLKKLRKQFSRIPNRERREELISKIDWLYAETCYTQERAECEFIKLKSQRIEALLGVDTNLVLTYAFGIPLKDGDQGKATPYLDAVTRDNELYQSILTQALKVREEHKPARIETIASEPVQTVKDEPKRQEQVVLHPALPHIKRTIHPVSAVVPNAVYNNGVLSIGAKERVKFFVDEVLNNSAYDERLKREIAHEALDSRWYEKGMSDTGVYSFFDDLELKARKIKNGGDGR